MPNPLEDFWKTKSFLQAMEVGAAGWSLSHQDAQTAAKPMVLLYAFDLPTGWTWLSGVSADMFSEMSALSLTDPTLVEPSRAGLAYVLSGVADGSPPEPRAGADWEKQLAFLLTAYAGTTKTWELADRFKAGGHFIVLNYRKSGSRQGLLRPVAMAGTGACLPATELSTVISQVMRGDRARHPEWFA